MIAQSVSFRDAAMIGRRDWLDTGVSNAQIQVFGTARPAAGDPPGAAALLTFTLTKPCGGLVDGNLELSASGFALVMNSGSPTWARWVNGDGEFAMDTDAGEVGSGAEVQVSEATVFAGGKVALISAVLG